MLVSGRVERKQIWTVSIKTVAQADDGTIHEHEMEWNFNKPMSMKEVIDGAKHIKVDHGGIKTRWIGVSKQWLNAVDEDLKGLTAIKAEAKATCVGMVNQVNPCCKILDKLVLMGV